MDVKKEFAQVPKIKRGRYDPGLAKTVVQAVLLLAAEVAMIWILLFSGNAH